LLHRHGVPEEKKNQSFEFESEKIQTPSQIRPEAKHYQVVDSKIQTLTKFTLCKMLSIAQDVCCRQHGSPADTYQCLHYRQLKRTVNNPVLFFHTSLKTPSSISLLFLPIFLQLGEDFSNLNGTQHSTMSTPMGCTSVVAYVLPAQGIKRS